MLTKNRNTILLMALVNLLLTPLYFYFSGLSSPKPLILINYALITFAGYHVCSVKRLNYIYLGTAVLVFIALIGLYFNPESKPIIFIKVTSIGVLTVLLFMKLMKTLWSDTDLGRESILGTVAGYILIGLFAGQLYELIHHAVPNSFSFSDGGVSDFQLFYYSFTGITTVGFGDITPTNPQSQAVTIIMNIAGQLYLAIVMAMVVGKFINSKNK